MPLTASFSYKYFMGLPFSMTRQAFMKCVSLRAPVEALIAFIRVTLLFPIRMFEVV